MMTETQPFGSVELLIEGTDQSWAASIEAQGTDHLRVRLDDDGDDMPHFQIGSKISCAMEDSSGRYSAGARVLSQNGPVLWLNVDQKWRKGGRRKHQRHESDFTVTYFAGETTGIGRCLNIAPGGMRLRVGEDLPLEEPVYLQFRLPHHKSPVRLGARVLYQRVTGITNPCLEAGLKFVELPFSEASRIASYCNG